MSITPNSQGFFFTIQTIFTNYLAWSVAPTVFADYVQSDSGQMTAQILRVVLTVLA